jgi:hypothetical protein
MTFASSTLTNTFLACIALTNLVVLLILYRLSQKQ